MEKAGLAAFEKRKDARSVIYSYENQPKDLDPEYEKRFKQNKEAWKVFKKQPPGYRRQMVYRVMSAKQEATRDKRLDKLIAASGDGKRL